MVRLTLGTRWPAPFTYDATGTPPAWALFEDGCTCGAPTSSNGAPLPAEYELLSTGHEDAHGAVVGRDGRDLHVLAEVLDRRVALVEQVVGRLAGAAAVRDLVVEARDLLRERIHRRDRRLEVDRHAGL